jgi:hypothetical protein
MSESESSVRPGRWYLCFQCHSCKEVIPFMEWDESAAVSTNGDGTFTIRCPRCAAKDNYQLKEFQKRSLETPSNKSSATKKPPVM